MHHFVAIFVTLKSSITYYYLWYIWTLVQSLSFCITILTRSYHAAFNFGILLAVMLSFYSYFQCPLCTYLCLIVQNIFFISLSFVTLISNINHHYSWYIWTCINLDLLFLKIIKTIFAYYFLGLTLYE